MNRVKFARGLLTGVLLSTALLGNAAFGQVGRNNGVLNPNLASEAELVALPQLGQPQVSAILEQRPVLNMAHLHALLRPSLGEATLTALYARLFIPIDLNTASEAEILLVPGVGPRMAHEFEEYRPYRALAQFRREIGKYVDDAEVERLEQYVYVPIDLNTASEADILSIPGVGPRMAHEFEEYRPYRALAQFRREIGKYVSDEEVTRLERYVTLN